MRDMVVIAGHVSLTRQLLADVAKGNCQEASDIHFAVAGERSECVCGQHPSPVPLAPMFDDAVTSGGV